MQEEVERDIAPDSTPEPSAPESKPVRRRRVYKWSRWTTIERDLRREKGPLLAGVDEVGRGPIAGPVVACAVIMPADTRAIPGVDDSKRLTHDQRVRLAVKIRERAVAFALGAASVREIDRINPTGARAARKPAISGRHIPCCADTAWISERLVRLLDMICIRMAY